MNDAIEIGNAYTNANARQWLIGSFIEDSPLRNDTDVEVKFVKLHAGEQQDDWTKNTAAKSLCILVRGSVTVMFQSGEFPLTKEGDYALWGKEVAHSWKVNEESLLVIVRWPSAPEGEMKIS